MNSTPRHTASPGAAAGLGFGGLLVLGEGAATVRGGRSGRSAVFADVAGVGDAMSERAYEWYRQPEFRGCAFNTPSVNWVEISNREGEDGLHDGGQADG